MKMEDSRGSQGSVLGDTDYDGSELIQRSNIDLIVFYSYLYLFIFIFRWRYG